MKSYEIGSQNKKYTSPGNTYWCFVLEMGNVKLIKNKKPFTATWIDKDRNRGKFGWVLNGKNAPKIGSTLYHNLCINKLNDWSTYVFDTEEEL